MNKYDSVMTPDGEEGLVINVKSGESLFDEDMYLVELPSQEQKWFNEGELYPVDDPPLDAINEDAENSTSWGIRGAIE